MTDFKGLDPQIAHSDLRAMQGEEEVFSQCPYCFSQISILCESLYGNQEYVEDCEVCCQPIRVRIFGGQDGVVDLQLDRLDD